MVIKQEGLTLILDNLMHCFCPPWQHQCDVNYGDYMTSLVYTEMEGTLLTHSVQIKVSTSRGPQCDGSPMRGIPNAMGPQCEGSPMH